jgi:hypothetical protein
VVLHKEQPVVEKRTVPRERVRLDKDTVTEEQQVGVEVRKEQIDLDEGGTDVRDDRRPSRSHPPRGGMVASIGGVRRCCAGSGHLPLLG